MGSGGIGQLKDRLKGFVKRTLRKQVLEYIRYTQRKAITVPFTPSHAEMQLYNGITAVLEREENVIKEAPPGKYQLIGRGQNQCTEPVNTHIYRLNHPHGEWVLETAKNQATPTAHIHFNYAAHGAKISVIESLFGQSGTLKLQRFSIEEPFAL
jgi:hypothetical protein